MRRFFRAPLLHFVLLGCALHVVAPWLEARFGPRPRIVLPSSEIAHLREAFEQQWGRPPTDGEQASLIEQAIDDEVVFRTAVELGFDRQNPFVDYRLETLMEFLVPEGEREPASLVDEARRLGLDRTDLVIRRQLIETTRVLLRKPVATEAPPEEHEIEATYRREAEALRRPDRVSFLHVYFSRDRRGDGAAADAREALDRIREEGLDAAAATRLGDPFLLGPELGPLTGPQLEARLGPGLAAGLREAPEGAWSGPIRSSWGDHLVFVRERRPGGVPPLSEVREQVLRMVEAERADRRMQQRIAARRARFDVRIGDAS